MTIVESLIIVVIGLIPALFSMVMMRKAEVDARERLRAVMNSTSAHRLRQNHYALSLSSDYQYIAGVGYLIGDLTCRFNARSTHLRCAVNPSGPCKDCPYYESIDFQH